ncbi:NAD(P)H-dependent flavin oxidoreductase [Lentibacillus jeotgali]|uniref:NAD(P)H-dependent flavin oxidoreductase n=1 Tax=Lentibacillus jeotgali TaxID=558169 RepID=UPI0002629365|nr:nitronate monooxygenase [Lentibacillus jeotgali]
MNTLMDKLGMDVPIIQAGMAGGITTPEMVASVANAGALGTIGAGYMSDTALKGDVQTIKQLTDKPFAVNLFAVNLEAFSDDIQPMQQFLNRYRDELKIDVGGDSVKVHDYLQEKVNVILEENIPIVSTAFGVLSYMLIDRLKANDVTLIGMATNLDEARQLEDAGYDAIVAQGTEAGGHRGTFNVDKYPNGCQTGLHVLVQELLNHIRLPVIAAGGIHMNLQVETLLNMGVAAVQLGTRFLVAKEAGTNTAYRRALIKAGTNDTTITKVFSGRPARAIRNRFIEEVGGSGVALQPFPIQNQMTKDIRSAGKEFAASEIQSLWAGQGVGAIKKEESAAEIVQSLVQTAGNR